jgi:hypothetical protein
LKPSVEEKKMTTALIDFTDKELASLKLGGQLVHIAQRGGALPRAQSALAERLADALVHLAAYKRAAPDTETLAAWRASCPRLYAAELPVGCVRRAAQLPLPSAPTPHDVDEQMRVVRELVLQLCRATMVSAAHSTNGCNRGGRCLFCF